MGLDTRLRWRNIGSGERRKRNVFGLATVGAIAAALLWHEAVPDLPWVLGVGFLAWSAALLLLQARAGVCVFHASAGTVRFARGTLPLSSDRIKAILRRRALRLHLLAATSWGVATSLCAFAKL